MKKLMLLVILAVFIMGCGGGRRASIEGYMYARHISNELVTTADIEVYKYEGFEAIPVVTVNGETLFVDNIGYSPDRFHYVEDVPWVGDGSEITVKVDYIDGRGEIKDTLPGEFTISSPTSSDTLRIGQDLFVNWQSSTGADWYWLTIDIDYTYRDTSGGFDFFFFNLDTIIYGTSYTLSASRIFPGDVDSIFENSAFVDLESYSGPELKVGAEGNVTGHAVGFFWFTYQAQGVWFNVQNLGTQPGDDHAIEIRENHRKILQQFVEEYQ